MIRPGFICGILLVVGLLGLILQGQTTVPASGDQDAAAMLHAYRDLKEPQPDMSRTKDAAYVESYLKERGDFETKRADLACGRETLFGHGARAA